MSKKRSLFVAGATTAMVAFVINASAAPAPQSPADHVTGNQPKSLSELQVMLDKGIVVNPALKFAASHGSIPETGIVLSGPHGSKVRGGSSDVVPACFSPRVQLPCGTYDVQSAFDADHGPFSRALGNLEDFGLHNAPAGGICTMNGEDINCLQHFDTPFRCAGPVLDAGDILTGVAFREGPPRPAGGFSGTSILGGSGFLGAPDKWISGNYFGDSFDVKFPHTPDTCGGSDPLNPKAWGGNVPVAFGSANGVTITATLDDDTTFAWHIKGSRPAAGQFTGVCCTQGIKKISSVDDSGTVPGYDNIKWTSAQGTCNPDFVPLTLENTRTDMECLADAIAALELKLDNGGGGGTSGSKSTGKRIR